MEQNYKLDTEDEMILDELDDLFGVVQNKEVLRDMITYSKLRKIGEVDFGNFNIIIRNESDYPLLEDFLKVCTRLFKKYQIISNEKICYWDKLENNRRSDDFGDKIQGIKESIIVISKDRFRRSFSDELDKWREIIPKFKKKIFVFEDKDFCEGELDIQLGNLVTWRMTIEKISLDDKLAYCKNQFSKNHITYYKEKDLKEFVDVPFWILKNMVFKTILDCKRDKIDFVDKQILKKNKDKFMNNKEEHRRETDRRKDEEEKNPKEELEELIGLDDVKEQVQKILNYVKLNKEKGKMPCLHMCFTGNPRNRKNKYCKNYWKII